jgi:hypothetical protein
MALANDTYAAANDSYQYEQYQVQQQSLEQHKIEWSKNCEAVVNDLPELNDPDSDLTKTVHELMGSDPRFSREVDGFEVAVALAQGKLATEENSGLKDELAKAKNEINRLNGLLRPFNSRDVTTHGGGGGSDLSNYSLAERSKILRARAEEEANS